ncbi:hypothetical protein AB0E67_13785 [Streptomyces sp. NPDC032161]|uniref:hypothetical protein n=1 Tax=unclassified Streptomyces TaxID=2593676 RepID=UPI0033F5D226
MESVPVRCPACRREHAYRTQCYPCPCGAPTAPQPLPGAPAVPVTHRTWDDDWVAVRCRTCGRLDHWPQPELHCPCGTVSRIPVRPAPPRPGPAAGAGPGRAAAPDPRPAFRPGPARTAHDAVANAARYLRWLGHHDVARPSGPSPERIDLRATGLIARVDTSSRPTTLRSVECLWLNALSASVTNVFFSLGGYARDAATRADGLGVPLFVMDRTGTPRPVNGPAEELIDPGA